LSRFAFLAQWKQGDDLMKRKRLNWPIIAAICICISMLAGLLHLYPSIDCNHRSSLVLLCGTVLLVIFGILKLIVATVQAGLRQEKPNYFQRRLASFGEDGGAENSPLGLFAINALLVMFAIIVFALIGSVCSPPSSPDSFARNRELQEAQQTLNKNDHSSSHHHRSSGKWRQHYW